MQHLLLSLVYKVIFQNHNSGLLRRMAAVMILLFAFEHFRHAEINANQKLSTATSRAAAPHFGRLVAGFSLRNTGIGPKEVRVASAVGKLTTEVFLLLLRYSPIKYLSTNDPHSFVYPVGDLRSKTVSLHPTNKTTQRPGARPFGNHNMRTGKN